MVSELPAKLADSTTEPSPATVPPALERENKHREGWLSEDHTIQKFAWESFVTLEGKNRFCQADCGGSRCAIHYLAKRDGPLCVVDDMGVVLLKDFDVDHIDKTKRNNRRWNLRLKHHTCNSSTQNQTGPTPAPSRVRESERMLVAGAGSELVQAGWSSAEGDWSEKFNAKIDVWLDDLENGPFVVRQEGQLVLVPVEIKHLARMGAAFLRSHFRRGSPITVERYLWTRSTGSKLGEPGMLRIEDDPRSGEKLVTYQGKNRYIPKEEKKTG